MEAYDDNDNLRPQYVEWFLGELRKGNKPYADETELSDIATILMIARRNDDSLFILDYAVKRYPNSVILLTQMVTALTNASKMKEASDVLKDMRKRGLTENGSYYIAAGWNEMAHRHQDKAIKCFDKAIKFDSLEHEIELEIALNLNHMGHCKLALKYIENLCRLRPNDTDLLFELGYAHGEAGDADAAIKTYQRLLSLQPFRVSAWFNVGNIYFQLGRLEESEDAFLNAIAIDMDYKHAYFNLGNVYMNMRKIDKAMEMYLEYLSREPRDINALRYMGDCWYDKHELEMARRFYDLTLKIYPYNGEALFGKGVCCVDLNNPRLGIKLLREAIRNDTSAEADAYLAIGHAYRVLGDYKRGYQNTLKGLKRDGDNIQGWMECLKMFLMTKPSNALVFFYENRECAANAGFQLAFFYVTYTAGKNRENSLDLLRDICERFPKAIEEGDKDVVLHKTFMNEDVQEVLQKVANSK